MADSVNTSTGTYAAIIAEVWSSKWYHAARAAVPFLDAISYDYEGEIVNRGDTVRIPDMTDITADELVEGASANAQDLTTSTTSLVIDKEIVADAIVTSKADLQSISHMEKVQDVLLNALAQKWQEIIINTIVPSAATPDHQISYDTGTTLVSADILEGKDLLDAQNCPDFNQRVMLTGTAQHNDMLAISGLIDKDTNLGDAPVVSGVIKAPVYGFRAANTTAAGTTTYQFHPLFMQAAMQVVPTIEVFKLGAQGKRSFRVNATLLAGLVQVKDTWVVSIS